MLANRQKMSEFPFPSIKGFPFGLLEIHGDESIDFLHRISTNDFSHFSVGTIIKTLLITDKGRIIDTVWVLREPDRLLMATSAGMADEIISWLSHFIIMENISLNNVTALRSIDLHFSQKVLLSGYSTEYFTVPVLFEPLHTPAMNSIFPMQEFEQWRIGNGIPAVHHEITRQYNPLELHLWDWISFSKGCYIGQEVIARLDTYKKIQRGLYRFSADTEFKEQQTLLDANGMRVGNITSVIFDGILFRGLAVVRTKDLAEFVSVREENTGLPLVLEPLYQKESHGRN